MGMFYGLPQGGSPRAYLGAALDARERSTQALVQLARLEERCERLAIVNEALWLLLKERVGLTEAELEAKVRQLDLAGGAHDALLERTRVECPQCHRPAGTKHRQCLYCGAPLDAPASAATGPAPDARSPDAPSGAEPETPPPAGC